MYRALAEGSADSFAQTAKGLRLQLVADVASASSESTKSVYPSLLRLQMLSEAEEALHLRVYASTHPVRLFDETMTRQTEKLLDSWQVFIMIFVHG